MKQRRRRITAMLLAAAMSVSLLPNLSVAFAAPTETAGEATPRAGEPQVGDVVTLTSADTTNAVNDKSASITHFFTIQITGADTCSIKEFNRQSKETSIKIPSYVTLSESNGGKTYNVTAIDDSAFASCGLTEVSFRGLEGDDDEEPPCKITTIGANAFASNLFSTITLPKEVTTIGDGAFSGASSLKTININELTSLTSIGANAFRNCTSLEELDMSATALSTIGMQAFYGSKALKYIKLPNDITSIGSQAFSDVAKSCFVDCSEVTKGFELTGAPWGGIDAVIYWGTNHGYDNNSPYIFDKDTGLIYGLKIGSAKYDTSEHKYTIDSTTKADNINYWYYSNKTLNGDPFNNPYDGFTILDDTKKPDGAPADVNLVEITLPEKIRVGTWTENTFDEETSTEYDVKGIAEGAFGSRPGNVAIKKIDFTNIKGGMDKIPYGAFWNATNLTDVLNIPEGVTSVGTYAFRKCTSLGKIELPSTVQEVNQWAFRECDALTTVTFNTRDAAEPSPAPTYEPPTEPGALTPIEDGNTYYTITQKAGEEIIGYIQGEIDKPTETDPVPEAEAQVSLSKVVELNGRYYVYSGSTYAPTVSLKWSDDGDGNGHYTGEITDYEYDSEIVYFAEAETLSADNAKNETEGTGETPAPDVAAADKGKYSGGKFSATKSQNSVTYLGENEYTKGTYSLTAYYIAKNERGVEIRTATQDADKSADNCLLKLIKKNDGSSANSEIIKEFTLNSEEKIGISGWLNGGSYNQGAWIDYVILRKTAEEQTCDIKQIHSGAFSKCKVLTKISMKGQFIDTDEKIYVTGTSDDDDPAAASAPFGAYDADIEYKDGTFDKTNVTSVEEDGIWTFNRLTGDVIGYDINNKENVTDSNYKTKIASKEITIPSELSYKKSDGTDSEKIKITGVGQYDENRPLFNAYHDGRVHIKNITIPDGVVRINDSVFYRTTIEDGKIKIPDSVESIRYRAFSNCGLKELTLPANLKTMGSYAFGNYGTDDKNNVPLNDIQGTVVFPRHVENIPNDVFSGNSSGTKTSPGNENIDTIHIQQYRYLETDAGYPERTDTFRQAAPEVYNNAPFGAKQDSEKASTVEYEDAYIPVLSDPEDTDHYHPTIAIEGKPDQKKETAITPGGGGDPITVKGGTAQINLALIMENSAFTIINAKSGVENESNEYFKNAAVTVTKPQLQSSGKYDGSQPYELNVTGITGNGSFVIEYSYGDVDGHLIGTNAVEIPIDCFHTAYYHDNDADSGVAPQLGADDGNGDAHYYVEGFNVPVKENNGNGKPGNILKKDKAVFMGWYVSDSTETPENVKGTIDLSTLKDDAHYIPEKMPADIVLASLEDPSSTAEMGETDLHFHAVWAADANGDGIPETSITGVNTVDLTYNFNGGKDKDSNEQYVASDVEKATNWPIADTEPKDDNVPKLEGATLVGWSTAPNNTGTIPAATKAAVDALVETTVDTTGTDPKVYAVWAADEYPGSNGDDPAGDGIPDYFQVKYEAGEGVTDAKDIPVDNGSYNAGDDVKVKPTDYGESEPTRKGWKFDGWTLKDDTSGNVYKSDGDNQTFKKNDKLDILVAKWTPEGYAVVYHGNGNTGGTVPADQSVAANTDGSVSTDDITVAADEPTRDYAVFLGWTTEQKGLITQTTDVPTPLYKKDGTTETFKFEDADGDRVMDLYAVWAVDMLGGTSSDKPGDGTPDYSQVIYDANAGGQADVKNMPTDTGTYESGASVSIIQAGSADPEREGYEFMGWSLNKVTVEKSGDDYDYSGLYKFGTDKASFNKSATADVLYAIWKPEVKTNFMVIYRPNDATSGNVPIDTEMYVQEDEKEITVQANKDGMVHDTSTKALKREGAIFLGWSLHLTDLVKNTEAETAAGIIPGTDTGEGTLTYDTYSGSIYGNVLNIFAVWAEDVNKNDTPDYEETTWFVKYNLNGGTYTDGEIPLDKGTDDKGYLAKTTAELKYSTEEEKKKLTHDDSDSHKVVFVGWTTSENPAIIDKEGTTVPELIEDKITMPDEPPKNDDETTRSHNVYAVWAVDENSNGEADYLESKVKLTYNYNNGTKAGDGSYSGDIERVAYYDKKRGEITPNPNYHPEPRGGKQEVFIGWSKERKADAVSSKPTDLLEKIDIQEENVTVYAVYAVDEKGDPTNRDGKGNGNPDYDDHKVTFDDGDSGTSLSPMPSDIPFAAPGEVITIEDKTPEREGYSFKGWKDPTNESGALLLPGGTFVMPDEDVTVTAQWEEKKGTVVYDNNHTALGLTADLGITGTLPTDSKKYAPGETVTIEAIAGDGKLTYTKPADSETAVEGAVFLGWSHDQRTLLTSAPAEGSVLTAGKTTPFAVNTGTDTMTLYAVWALDADNNDQADYIDGLCTIVYDDGVEGDPSGVTNLPPTVSVNPAENYTISNIEPSRTGYRFTGWKIDGDETNYRYTGGTSVVPAGKLNKGETVTLVAQWAAAYGVVYRANYGTGTVPEHSDSYAKDGEGTVTLDDPTGLSRDGYTFLGWTAHYAADPVTTKEAETKLLEGKGTGPNDIKMYKVGDSETKPTFTLSPDNDTYMIFYAVWAVDVNKNGKPDYSEDPWTLVYDAGEDHTINGETDGTPQTKEVKDQSYISGATVYLVRSVKPVKTPGMTFIGWSEKKPEAVYTTEPDASVLTETVTFGDDSDEAGTKTVYAVYAQDNDNNDIADYLEGKVRLIYDLNGGKLGDSEENIIVYYDAVESGRTVQLNNERRPERKGGSNNVVFVGWSITKPGEDGHVDPIPATSTKSEIDAYLKTSVELNKTDVTVYAVYAVDEMKNGETDTAGNGVPDYNRWTVTYNLGDYTDYSGDDIKDKHDFHEPGDEVDLQTAPARDGYEFVGWKDDGDGSVYVPDSTHSGKYTMPERNVTFTAQWIESDGYIVRYNLNGGTGAIADSEKYVKEEGVEDKYYIMKDGAPYYKAVIPESKPTRTNAVFLGWSIEPHDVFTSAPAEGIVYTSANAPEFKPEKDGRIMNLYAVWAINENESAGDSKPDYEETKLNIKYADGVLETDAADSKDVANMPPAAQVLKGLNYTIPNVTPSRTGYTFDNWSDGAGHTYDPGDKIENVSADITLTATWEAAYHVSYNANGGTGALAVDKSKTFKINDEVTIDNTIPTRVGYAFLGWTAHEAQDPVTTKEKKEELNGSILAGGSKIPFALSPDNDSYMIFYAVWAVDANKNGTPDYDEQWHILYDHNGGTFDAHQGRTDYTISALTYPSSPNVGDGDMVFLNNAVKPTHTAIGGVPVTFAGWTTEKSYAEGTAATPVKAALSADEESTLAEKLVDYVRMPKVADWNKAEYKHGDENGYYPVYAVWATDNDNDGVPDYQEGKMRLIYNLDGGEFGGGKDDIIRYLERPTENGTITLNESFKPTRGDKEVFVGWTTIKPTGSPNNAVTTDPTDTAGFCKDNIANVTANQAELTVYAVYAKDEWGNGDTDGTYDKPNGVPDYNKHKVTYDLGTAGGTAVTGTAPTDIHTDGHEPGDLVDLAPAPEYTGFSFVGWKDTGVDGSDGSVYMPDSEHNSKYTMPERDVKFVAQWIDSDRYMVRYHLNGGTGTVPENSNLYAKSTKSGEDNVYYLVNEDDSVTETKTVTLAAAGTMSRGNAVFLGWSVNEPKALVTAKDADTGYSKTGDTIDYAPETGGVIMNLYAVWAADENGDGTADYEEGQHISVTFEANDSAPAGTQVQPDTMPANATVLKGVDYNIPGREPVRAGYTFLGWKIKGGDDTIYKYGGDNAFVPKDKMGADITLVAQWGADYGIAYHANGGTGDVPTDESKYELGANVTVKFDPIPTRAGYIFLGWSKNKQYEPLTAAPSGDDILLKGTAETTAFAVEENSTVMNLYALWTADANNNNVPDYDEQWHIVYDHNGGTFDAGQGHNDYTVSAQTYNSSTDIEPVRAFLNGSVKPTHEKQGDTAVVFVGWTLKKTENILPSNVPSAEQPELITNVTMPQQSEYADKDGKVTVYAVWALDVDGNGVADYLEGKVRLIYNANGGKFGTGADASAADIIVYYDAADERTVTLNESRELSRNDGEVFVGWSITKPTRDKDPITVGEENRKSEIDAYLKKEVSLTTEDVTVYAVYAVDEDENGTPGHGKPDYDFYTVTYELNGGISVPPPIDSNKYEPGEIVTIYGTEPMLANSAFDGWKSSDESDTTKYRANDSFVMPAQDITLTAQWTEKTGNVKYNLNGGTGTAPIDNASYDAGDVVTVKEASDITRDKAVFLGWSHDKRSTLLTETPAENSILNADGTTGANGGGIAALKETTFAPDEVDGNIMTLYAVWAADTNGNGKADYTEELWHIVYDHNGGTYNDEEKTTSSADYLPGTTVALHADILPIREPSTGENSYHFVGWTIDKRNVLEQNDPAPTDDDLITQVTIPTENTDDNIVTVYALWAIDTIGDGAPDYQDGKVKLIYNFDGGTFSGRQEIDRYLDASEEDRTITLNETFKPVRGDKEVFVGWTSTVPPTEHRAAATAEPEDLLKNGLVIKSTDTVVTVYAVYAVDEWGNGDEDGTYDKPNGNPDYNKHKVTYDLGYYPAYQDVPVPGEAPTDAHNVTGGHEPGDFVDLQTPPTVDGVIFEGWKDIDGDDSVYMPGDDGRKYTMPDREVEFVAQWIKGDRYTVKYNANDVTSGDVPTDDTEYILEETTQTPELTKYFYFISSGENAGTRYYNVNVKDAGTLKKDNAVFVGWTLTPLDPITLDPDKEESKVTYYTEATTDLAYAPEEGGKIMNLYALWAVDSDGDGVADYAEGKYAIEYKNGVNEGDADYENPQIKNMPENEDVLPNEDYTIPNYIPTRPHYTFECWTDGSGKTYKPGDKIESSAITGTVTLTAQWLPDNTVKYHANNGAGTPPVDDNRYADGINITLAGGEGLTMEGHVFIGWTLHESYPVQTEKPTITFYEAGAQIPYERDKNTTVMNVYALWAVDENGNGNPDYYDLTLSFADGVKETDSDYNAGISPVRSLPQSIEGLKPGVSVTLPDQKPTRVNYNFMGWIDPANPSKLLEPGDSLVMPDTNVTLTASWEKKSGGSGSHGSGGSSGGSGGGSTQYTLKYETNGGSEIADERYSSGKEVTLDKTPTREGYVFDGWYSDKGLTEKAEKIKMTKNTTVYAKWVEEKPDDTKDPSGTGSGSSSSDILNTDDHFAYVMGYEDSTVRPNNNITRAETVAIFYRLLKADVRNSNMSSTNKFEDVSADNWYNVSVSTMANVGIVSGRSDTEFAPEAPITRAEFAAICARFDDSANVEPSGFSDIDGHWAKPEVERAAALGWVSGYEDGTFRPDRFITRAEAMTMINRVLGRIPESVDDLSDGMTVWSDNSDSTAWFYLAVQEATNGHYAEKKNDTYEKWTKVDQSVTWDK